MVTFAIGQAAFFASSVVLMDTGGMGAFTVEQRTALAMLCIRISGMIGALFLAYYGLASMVRGYLISRSDYLPRVLGMLLMIGGAGFFLRTVTYVVAPAYSSPWLLLPMAVGGIGLMVWLIFKGAGQRGSAGTVVDRV